MSGELWHRERCYAPRFSERYFDVARNQPDFGDGMTDLDLNRRLDQRQELLNNFYWSSLSPQWKHCAKRDGRVQQVNDRSPVTRLVHYIESGNRREVGFYLELAIQKMLYRRKNEVSIERLTAEPIMAKDVVGEVGNLRTDHRRWRCRIS